MRRLVLCVVAWLVVAVCGAGAASASVISVGCSGTTGDTVGLISAINQANGVTGPDTIDLGTGCQYAISAVNNNWYGPNGLPPIVSDITIDGHGSTIERSGNVTLRLFFVGADPASPNTLNYTSPGAGTLTLRDVVLSNGDVHGGDSNGGGGGAGMGGAIFSQGTVVIVDSAVIGNEADGGIADDSFAGLGGGGIGSTGGNGAMGSPAGGGFGGVGTFGGASGGVSTGGGGGGGGGFAGENGANAVEHGGAGAGGGPDTGLGGDGGIDGIADNAGDGSGGGADAPIANPTSLNGGAFGFGGQGGSDGGGGGGVGGGGGGATDGTQLNNGGGGGFGGGGGGVVRQSPNDQTGGSGGFGGGGGNNGGAGGFGGGTGVGDQSGGGAGMGGAIFNMQGTLAIEDSTFVDNSAIAGGDNVPAADKAKGIGGAVFNLNGTFTAVQSTFAGNTAADDAAQIFNLVYDDHTARTAATTLRDTAVARGIGPADLASVKTASIEPGPPLGTAVADVSQFDFVSELASPSVDEEGTVVGSPLGGDPLLGPLGSTSPNTPAESPDPGSPLIDAGDPDCTDTSGASIAVDQNGSLRPGGTACDIGAVEIPRAHPVTGQAAATGPTTATLQGAAGNPGFGAGSAVFEFGTTTAYGQTTATQALSPRTAATPLTAAIANLTPNTTYHFRVDATNSLGTVDGADHTFTTPPAIILAPSPPAVTAITVPAITKLALTPSTFRAATSGASVTAAKAKTKKKPAGTEVSFTLSVAATVRFTITESKNGRRAKSGRCVAQTTANRHAKRCTRTVTLSGRFSRTGRTGSNSFHFTGRLSGHMLKPASYHLTATPTTAGKSGVAKSITFHVSR